MPRELLYTQALAEALEEVLDEEPRVTLFGANFVGAGPDRALMASIRERFAARIVWPPIAELASCGIAIGAAPTAAHPNRMVVRRNSRRDDLGISHLPLVGLHPMALLPGRRRGPQNMALGRGGTMLRSSVLIVVAVWLCLATAVFADDESDAQSAPTVEDQQSAPVIEDQQGAPAVEDQAPRGPVLQPADYAPLLCDPSYPGFRYLEVRGVGFDTWATQRLVGNVVDASGVPRIHWSSIWVSPRGQLTLEVNLCTDPFRNRPALPAGDYTVSVGPASGAPIAATTISVSPPVAE